MPEHIRHTPPTELADLLPVRMCNELVYCERLFYLEYVQGYFVDSSDTVEGRAQHERARRGGRRKKVLVVLLDAAYRSTRQSVVCSLDGVV